MLQVTFKYMVIERLLLKDRNSLSETKHKPKNSNVMKRAEEAWLATAPGASDRVTLLTSSCSGTGTPNVKVQFVNSKVGWVGGRNLW